jgi:2-oxoglutarate ferredoxin oxidoreductase subunit gamma
MRREVILSGAGGQGLILAGAMLAEAAGIFEEREVVQTQAYGIQARGGASQSSVIISDTRIKFPEVRHPDILLCLSQEAYLRYSPCLKPGGLLIIDEHLVSLSEPVIDFHVVALPFTAEAERLSKRILANVMALGAISALTEIVRRESLAKAIPVRLPERNVPGALEALEVGVRLGEMKKVIQSDRN